MLQKVEDLSWRYVFISHNKGKYMTNLQCFSVEKLEEFVLGYILIC